jgi:hypothetical protein
MEFLSIDTSYSDGSKGRSSEDKVNIILSTVNKGLESKEQKDLNNFVGGLTESHSKYFTKVISSTPKDKEKAIISALLNKYPELESNEDQKKDFKEHVSNLLKEGKLRNGALKYLLERLLGVEPNSEEALEDSKEGKKEEKSKEDDFKEKDSENSDLDFYSEWDKEFKDSETSLSEEDFYSLTSEEELDNLLEDSYSEEVNLSQAFLQTKKDEIVKDKEYTSLMKAEDFIVDKLWGEERLYSDYENKKSPSKASVKAAYQRYKKSKEDFKDCREKYVTDKSKENLNKLTSCKKEMFKAKSVYYLLKSK